MHRYDNLAEVYFHKSPELLINSLPSRAEVRKKLLRILKEVYGEEQLKEGIQFLPPELAALAGLSVEALRRCLSQMDAQQEMTYIPPFRGRGLRLLKRVEPENLNIDFETLRVRKGHELAKLDQVMAYASTRGCRRRFLLRYFGEGVSSDGCKACDVCKSNHTQHGSQRERSDPVLAVKILSGVARLKGRFGLGMAAKVLTGSKDRMLIQFGLQHFSTYGLLSECTQIQVQGWIKELIAEGCIFSTPRPIGKRNYSVPELTARGRQVMAEKEVIRLSQPAIEQRSPSLAHPSLQESEIEIFNRLRELRASLARQEKLPPYCIFHDRTLREMARALPSTPDELFGIVGVGEVTLKKYGKAILKLLNQIRYEHHSSGETTQGQCC